MYSNFFKFVTLLCCVFLTSCASGNFVGSVDGVLKFEKIIQDNEKGFLCGQLDPKFISKEKWKIMYLAVFLVLQKSGDYANESEAEKNQITVQLAHPYYNTFSIPLPPGNYYPIRWQCLITTSTSKNEFHKSEIYWSDSTSKAQGHLSAIGKSVIEDPFPQSQIMIERGKFTYIGKIKLLLPMPNTQIEDFTEYLNNEIKVDSEEIKASLKYGRKFDSAGLRSGLTVSDKDSIFLYTYVSDSPDDYKKRFKEVFGLSPVFKKISFDGEAFNTSLIRGVGFILRDLR